MLTKQEKLVLPKRVCAIDPSLTASGWALFEVDNARLLSVGVISPPGPSETLAARLDALQEIVEAFVLEQKLNEEDVLLCEGPAHLVLNPQSALKVERVRGVFESVARVYGVCVPGRLNPRTVQSELLGMRGPQLPRAEVKTWARATAMRLYGKELERLAPVAVKKEISQDIIDAVLIGALAVSRVKMSAQTGVGLQEAFSPKPSASRKNSARGAVRWTEKDVRKLQGGGK